MEESEQPKKAAIYARVSTDKQELENQLIELRKYAAKSNYEVFHEYTDITSGGNDRRPAWDMMFAHASQRLFDIVLFWDLSRFSRSGTLYTLQKFKQLNNYGVDWDSYQEQYFRSAGAFKDVVISIMATLAKIEREKISERTKAGLARARAAGRIPGRQKGQKDVKPRKQRSDRGIKRGVQKKPLKLHLSQAEIPGNKKYNGAFLSPSDLEDMGDAKPKDCKYLNNDWCRHPKYEHRGKCFHLNNNTECDAYEKLTPKTNEENNEIR